MDIGKKDNWAQLPPEESAKFLQAVEANGDAAFFDASLCDVHQLELSFFDGYSLLRIVNKHSIPFLLLDYLSDGVQHYYLDGSERAFHNISAQGSVNLNTENVGQYIDLFISYVYERGNSLIFLRDDELKAGFPAPVHDPARDVYAMALPLIYHDREVQSKIEISRDGKIHVLSPLKVSFLTEINPDADNPYRHPREAEIIEQAKGLLSITATGQALLEEMSDATLRVLSSPNYQGFVTNNAAAYITMPAAEQNAKYTQALILASCLHDIKQVKSGYIYAHPVADEALYATVNYGKNLDILTETCKIIEEYEAQSIPEALDAFKKMDFESVYEGYKQGKRHESLMQVYIEALQNARMLED